MSGASSTIIARMRVSRSKDIASAGAQAVLPVISGFPASDIYRPVVRAADAIFASAEPRSAGLL